jgi:hypothetical protein
MGIMLVNLGDILRSQCKAIYDNIQVLLYQGLDLNPCQGLLHIKMYFDT